MDPVTIPAMAVMEMGPVGKDGEVKCVDFRVLFDPSPVMEKIKAA